MIHFKFYILLQILFTIKYSKTLTSPDTTENAAKRFTLQDLLSSQTNQIVGAPQQMSQEQAQPTSVDEAPKTQAVDIQTLLAAAQKAAAANSQQPSVGTASNSKPIDIDVTPDKNGNIDLSNIQGMISDAASRSQQTQTSKAGFSLTDLQSLISKQNAGHDPSQNIVKEEIDLGKEKLELEAAGKRETRYALARGPDGGLNLVPVVEGAQQTDGNKLQVLQPKGFEEKGSNRQQMQLTTLSQALYSPFPSDQNTLHLHLKGKDGKDGKPGAKGPMGPLGPKGPEGPKGPKGDPGTCSSQINGLFECTPDELDSLSNRVDYLEKICHKVESGAKKHKIHSNSTSSNSKAKAQESHTDQHKETKAKEEKLSEHKKESEDEGKKDDDDNEKEKESAKQDSDSKHKNADDEKDEKESETSKIVNNNDVNETGDKKHFTAAAYDEKKPSPSKDIVLDPATAALKSMIDVRAKLKISELDLLDRIKQAKEGTMKNL